MDTPGENELYTGQLSADRQVFAIAKGVVDSGGNVDTTLAVGVRAAPEGTSYDLASLNGEYSVGGLSIVDIEDASGEDRDGGAFWGSIVFDGAGGATYTGGTFGADADVSVDTGSGTYTVASNGDVRLLLTVAANEPGAHVGRYEFRGHLSTDGEVLAMEFGQTDGDGDGLSDIAEYGPDGDDPTYDGNGDGIADSEQSNVTSCPTAGGGKYVTLSVSPAYTLTDVATMTNPDPATAPADMAFDWGFLDFTIGGLAPGNSVELQITLPQGDTVDNYYKYGPTAGDPAPHWYGFEFNVLTGLGAEYNANVITLHLQDGADGDDDITANGAVRDVGGPAVVSVGAGGGANPGAGATGGSSGCFIGSLK